MIRLHPFLHITHIDMQRQKLRGKKIGRVFCFSLLTNEALVVQKHRLNQCSRREKGSRMRRNLSGAEAGHHDGPSRAAAASVDRPEHAHREPPPRSGRPTFPSIDAGEEFALSSCNAWM